MAVVSKDVGEYHAVVGDAPVRGIVLAGERAMMTSYESAVSQHKTSRYP